MRLPKTTQEWLFVEKWGLLTLVACAVVFGLFLQCGGVFFYSVEDCADFTPKELSIIRSGMGGHVNSASDCAGVNKWMIEWYRLRKVKDSTEAEALMSKSKESV